MQLCQKNLVKIYQIPPRAEFGKNLSNFYQEMTDGEFSELRLQSAQSIHNRSRGTRVHTWFRLSSTHHFQNSDSEPQSFARGSWRPSHDEMVHGFRPASPIRTPQHRKELKAGSATERNMLQAPIISGASNLDPKPLGLTRLPLMLCKEMNVQQNDTHVASTP